jgi:hypothetical protein
MDESPAVPVGAIIKNLEAGLARFDRSHGIEQWKMR